MLLNIGSLQQRNEWLCVCVCERERGRRKDKDGSAPYRGHHHHRVKGRRHCVQAFLSLCLSISSTLTWQDDGAVLKLTRLLFLPSPSLWRGFLVDCIFPPSSSSSCEARQIKWRPFCSQMSHVNHWALFYESERDGWMDRFTVPSTSSPEEERQHTDSSVHNPREMS